MIDDLRKSLVEVGLCKKEADVYLSMLELGPASVQDISKRAGVNRTTTYVMLEALKRRGLMSSFEKGKKVFFVAEDPHKLLALVTEQLSIVAARKDRMQSFMPRLLAIFNAIDDKPKVRFFEGEDALDSVRYEMNVCRDRPWEFYAVDETSVLVANIRGERRVAMTKQMRDTRLLMAIKPGCTPAYFHLDAAEARVIDYRAFPFSGAIKVAGNKICIIAMRAKGMGIVVDSKEISNIFRALYESVWQQAKPWKPTPEWYKQAERFTPVNKCK